MKKFWNFINKTVNGFVEHIGSDKLLHFLTGAWLTSMVSPLGFWWVLGMFIFIGIISYVKEAFVDKVSDKYDFIAGVSGSLISFLIWFLLYLIL